MKIITDKHNTSVLHFIISGLMESVSFVTGTYETKYQKRSSIF